jgi:GcrA cell cycle regulator
MIDAIADLWARGEPTSEIAASLRITRNRVAGLIHRARGRGDERFPKRPPAMRPPKPESGTQVRKRRVKPAGEAVGNRKPPSPALPVKFEDLGYGRCRWALNDAPPGQMNNLLEFCGRPAADGPYCEIHARLARPREPGRS